jgi:hypothetical protein
MNYNNDKLNEIYRDTWPNLGWAARMNEDNLPVPDDMCWVNLTKEEIEELRNKKHTLTEYGKEQLRKLMTYPDDIFEEAARREAENDDDFGQLGYLKRMEQEKAEEKVTRQQAMQIAVGAINKHSDALKELAKTEKEELKAELEALKKENFQKVAECCMEEYNQKYGDHKEDPYWIYMIADYFGTGEGQTVSLMVTQANARGDDYLPDGPDRYKPVNTKAYRAVREFHKEFGTWQLYGLRFLSKEAFYSECVYYIPPVMMKLSNAKCYKRFYTEVHYNFS